MRRTHDSSRLLVAATLLGTLLLAGCGRSAPVNTIASVHAAGTRSHTTSTVATNRPTRSNAGAPPSQANLHEALLAYAKCMRANGVTNFPDPSPGVFGFPVTGAQRSPAFASAQAKCQRYMPGGGPLSGPPASAKTMSMLLRIAECMRRHGVSDFPDPQTRRPSLPLSGKYQEITNYDGAFLLFPATLNLQSPAYRNALKACGAPPLGLPH